MTAAIVLTLPYPPSANRYWATRVAKAAGKLRAVTYVTADANAYKAEVQQIARAYGVREPIACRAEVAIRLYPQRPQDWERRARLNPLGWDDDVRSIDLDNANKVLLDALKGVVLVDDSRRYVRRIISEHMEPDGKPARVLVAIRPLVVVSPQADLLEAA